MHLESHFMFGPLCFIAATALVSSQSGQTVKPTRSRTEPLATSTPITPPRSVENQQRPLLNVLLAGNADIAGGKGVRVENAISTSERKMHPSMENTHAREAPLTTDRQRTNGLRRETTTNFRIDIQSIFFGI